MKKIRASLTWIGLLCVVSSFLACGGPEQRRTRYYEKGKILFENNDYSNARLELKNAVQVDPKFVEGYLLLGKIEIAEENYNQASKYFNKILQFSPENIESRIMLAEIGLSANDYIYAMKNVKEVLRVNPVNVKAQITEAYILAVTGKKPQARVIIEKMMAEGKDDPDLYLILAATYSWGNENKIIEDIYKKGISKNSDSSSLLQALISLYISEKRNEEALSLFTKLIDYEPKILHHRFSLAQLYWNMGRHSDADQIIATISATESGDEEVILLSTNFYVLTKRYEFGEKILVKALKQKPENLKYRFTLSDLYVMQGKNQKAIDILEQYLLSSDHRKRPLILKVQNALARIYLNIGNSAMALDYVEKVIVNNKHDRVAHFTKGKVFLIQGQGDKAITEFLFLTKEYPLFIAGHVKLAEAYVMNKNYGQAVQILQEALRVNAESKELLQSLALVYLLSGNKNKAEAQLREILELNSDDFQARMSLADLLFDQDKISAAEVEYKKMIELVPNDPAPYLRLSHLLWSEGRKDEALSTLENSLLDTNSSQQIFSALVHLYTNDTQLEKAIALCNDRMKRDPGNAFNHYILARVYFAGKKYSLAENAFNQAIEIAPLWLAPLKDIATLYKLQGREEEAIGKLEQTLVKQPKRSEVYIILALLYELQKDFKKAINTYERALVVNSENWVAANNIAYALMEYMDDKGSMEKALVYAKKAKLLMPQLKEVADTLGWAYFKNGKYSQALTVMNDAFAVSPDNPTVLFHMALILYKNGKVAEAKANIVKALKSEKDFPSREQAEVFLQNSIVQTK